MTYSNKDIYLIILRHINTTSQKELRYIMPFCIGYFDTITVQIWGVIQEMLDNEFITCD